MSTGTYDSRNETVKHIKRVERLLADVRLQLHDRGIHHDESKLGKDEKPTFDCMTEKLRTLTYGSDEYKAALAQMQTALDHHYRNNRHHPEHFANGVDDMTLVDVVEMLCDWKAASERHADGCIVRSIKLNQERFQFCPQLAKMLLNTARSLGWAAAETE